jgi:hypothetical protein
MSSNVLVNLELPQLPPKFMERVSRFEGEVESQCSVENIKSLMELYTVKTRQAGIEYFESVNDLVFLKYQEKLQGLLSRKDVQEALAGPPVVKKPPAAKMKSALRPIPKKPLGSREVISTLTEKRSAELLLNTQLRNATASKRTLQESVKSQKDSLELRMQQRRSSCGRADIATRSPMTSPKAFGARQFFESDLDKQMTPSKVALMTDEFERELEAIMEDHVKSKLDTLKQIRERYEVQIADLSRMPESEVISQLLATMRERMEADMKTAQRELEEHKAHRIAGLKQRLHV